MSIFVFSNASVVYVYLPAEMLAPSLRLYDALVTFLAKGGQVHFYACLCFI